MKAYSTRDSTRIARTYILTLQRWTLFLKLPSFLAILFVPAPQKAQFSAPLTIIAPIFSLLHASSSSQSVRHFVMETKQMKFGG